MSTLWAEKYVGLSFLDGGRDFTGLDCWGLVRLVLKRECKIEVPSYGEISATELAKVANMIASESIGEPWVPSINVQKFDVAVIHRRQSPIHVGIMVSSTMILHIEQSTLSVLVSLQNGSMKFRAISFFRHRELLSDAA